MNTKTYLSWFIVLGIIALPTAIFIVYLWQLMLNVDVSLDIGRLAFLRTVVFNTLLSLILIGILGLILLNDEYKVMIVKEKVQLFVTVTVVLGFNFILLFGGNFVSMKLAPNTLVECVYWPSISANLDSSLGEGFTIEVFDIVYVNEQVDYQAYNVFNLKAPHETNVQIYDVSRLHPFESSLNYERARITERHQHAKNYNCQALDANQSLENAVYIVQGNVNGDELSIYAVRIIPGYNIDLPLSEQSETVKNLLENITRTTID